MFWSASCAQCQNNAGLDLNKNLIMEPDYVAKFIINAGKSFEIVPNWKWKIIYWILKLSREFMKWQECRLEPPIAKPKFKKATRGFLENLIVIRKLKSANHLAEYSKNCDQRIHLRIALNGNIIIQIIGAE